MKLTTKRLFVYSQNTAEDADCVVIYQNCGSIAHLMKGHNIDASKRTNHNIEFSYTYRPSDLPRLLTRLSDDGGDISVVVTLKENIAKQLLLFVRLQGVVTIPCMRCMQDFSYPLDISHVVELLLNEEACSTDSADYEQLVLKNGYFNVEDLVVDELFLSLPEHHENAACSAKASQTKKLGGEVVQGAFSRLKDLLAE